MHHKEPKNFPIVIFLNGTSSAGKTSLVAPLQELAEFPLIHIGIDHFLSMVPNRYRMDGLQAHLGYHFKQQDTDEAPMISITKGLYAHKINTIMRATIKSFLDEGFNLVIDEVLFADDDYHAYLSLLKNYRMYFIAVKPPLEVCVTREKLRGDRMIGLARGLYDRVHQNKQYHLEVDTSCMTPIEAATLIMKFVS